MKAFVSGLGAALLLALAGCSGGGAGGAGGGGGPRVAQAAPEDIACSRDDECALVEDCCGCAMGGTKTAVRTDRVETLSAAAGDACGEPACPGTPSQHRSCTATAARCVGGRCIPAL